MLPENSADYGIVISRAQHTVEHVGCIGLACDLQA